MVLGEIPGHSSEKQGELPGEIPEEIPGGIPGHTMIGARRDTREIPG